MHYLKARLILCYPWGVVDSTSSIALSGTPKMVLGDVQQTCRAISQEVLVLVPRIGPSTDHLYRDVFLRADQFVESHCLGLDYFAHHHGPPECWLLR